MESSVGRGFDILSALTGRTVANHHGVSISDLARDMGRDRSQVSRALNAMAEEEFLLRDAASRTLAPHWRLYADAQELTAHRLRTDGQTALEGLAADTGESCYLGILVGDATVTIAERVPPGSNQIGSWIGRPYPAYCSDCGQALLCDAEDDEVASVLARTDFVRHGPNTPTSVDDFLHRLAGTRERGYSVIDEEAEPGLYSIAAPVRDFRGEVIAAIQIVGPRVRLAPRTDDHAAAALSWSRWLQDALRGHNSC
ncbi:IclR family transcriptional regulator [Streptomyces sp. NPDC001020]